MKKNKCEVCSLATENFGKTGIEYPSMEFGKIPPRRESPSINSEEWLAELDRVMSEDSPSRSPIITDRGFTVMDIVRNKGTSVSGTKLILLRLTKSGKVQQIGWRPGQNGGKVYEFISKTQE